MRILTLILGLALTAPVLVLGPGPVHALQPDELLADPEQEARARELSKGLRCMVCRNESIDESNADLARDMRLLVRERIVAGDSNEEVLDFVVDRYGEYALLNPTKTGSSLILWIAGPVMLVIALGVGLAYQRRQRLRGDAPVEALNEDEAARLQELLGDPDVTKRSG
ncbi:MAG: cytochrome c-type biogenesis protein CcmH [Rhodobacteraceae bacterium]|nr:cytochrome c-type biogenesis protein CcmH [Paracoccaceae bacterium]